MATGSTAPFREPTHRELASNMGMSTIQRRNHNHVRLSTLALVTVAMFDLVSTLMWLNAGHSEGNPLFAWLATHGTLPFVFGKLVFLVLPIVVIEWARTKRPWTAEIGTWFAVGAYAWLWTSHVLSMR